MICSRSFRPALLAAASSAALVAGPAFASSGNAEFDPTSASMDGTIAGVENPEIVIRDGFDPNAFPPDGILDPTNINGIGQVIGWNGDGTVGTCTGTLINPRTVIFAAHCVNDRAASDYSAAEGGVPIGVGFANYTIPGIFDWLDAGFQTVEGSAFYNAEHIWYDERSLDGGFLQADIAIATLDTPAFDIPTWAMLFTPLDQQEHVTVSGYGSIGGGEVGAIASGGFRRRAAENYVSFLGSLADRNAFLFGDPSGAFAQNLYMATLTDPDPDEESYDFGLFGPGDVALPREGLTAPGDSGGPLILDEKYDIPLVLGVLSGGSRFFAGQPFSSYGTHNFYQPLYAFWDVIVANNPYVYATNKAGDGQWTDPGHWVQAMDPNYMIALDGELINGVPDTQGIGTGEGGAKFGQLCFFTDCVTPVSDPQVGDGTPHFVPGGPGSENFIPDNVVANVAEGVRPRYFDVTLSADGSTRLSGADVTIDRLTVHGATKLDIARNASLTSLGDFTQVVGWTNIDGILDAREAFLLTGVLSGNGTLRAPWVTTAATVIAPGGADAFGTLTIDGNLVMGSGSALFIDAGRSGADLLSVTGLLSLSDPDQPGTSGPSLVFNKVGAAPRHGQSFTIAVANGGIEGTFGQIFSFQGVLRPELTYGENEIVAELRAGSLATMVGGKDPTARAFASALDQLRDGSYTSLYNLYGMIDLLDAGSLSQALNNLAPNLSGGASLLQERQSKALFGAVSDRLSLAGLGSGGSLKVVGSPNGALAGLTSAPGSQAARLGISGLHTGGSLAMALPETMSGFVAGGAIDGGSASAVGGEGVQRGTYFAMGMERRVADDLSVGVAVGHAEGTSLADANSGRSVTNQVAAYGSRQLGGGAYLGLVGSFETIETRHDRSSFDGLNSLKLHGDTRASRLSATAEAGINLPLTAGLTLTPRAQFGYSRFSMSGFGEQGGETALNVDSLSTEQLEARLGAKLAGSEKVGNGWTFVPELKADYVRIVDGANDGLTVRFAAADHVPIALPLAQGDSNWGELRGAAKLSKGAFSFGAGVETSVARDDLADRRAMAEFSVRF